MIWFVQLEAVVEYTEFHQFRRSAIRKLVSKKLARITQLLLTFQFDQLGRVIYRLFSTESKKFSKMMLSVLGPSSSCPVQE
jgi:hypothetical protein